MKEADRLRRENEALRTRVARLSRVSLRVTESLDLDTVLQEVVDGARSLTGARYGAVGVFDDSGHVQDFITSGITPEERRLLGDLPKGLGILGFLNEIREPLRLADLTQHPKSIGFPEHHPPMRTFLGAPIRHLGEPVGNIYLTEKEGGREFTLEDEEILVMFASQAAMAISNALKHRNEQWARAAAETERQRLEALVGTSPVGVLVVDAETRILEFVNQEAERIIGIPAVPGSSIEQFFKVTIYRKTDGREYLIEERPFLRALMHGEVVRAEEVLLERAGGGTIMVLVNATPIYSDAGEITSAVAVIQDMTPLEEAERLRNEFLGMVSHELRTPLTTIKGCASVVLDSSTRPPGISELLQYFRMIDEQSDHLRDLVNNLLDMTQIEAGALSVTIEPVDAKTLIDEVKMAFVGRGMRNTVEVDLPPDLPLIAADKQRIAQVLNNLLSNASKYSSETSTIRVTGSRNDFQVAISVTDEGRGIPASQMTNLFRKFSRIHEGEGDLKIAGTGLGLVICKGIVEAHGGRIWAESSGEGRGTLITFTIPEAAVQGAVVDAPAAVSAGNRSILAVDDEPQVLRLLRNILTGHGYRPLGAASYDEMMRLLESECPDLILLDLMMPRTSGFELMRKARQVSKAPIIFLSANDQEENITKALDMGADDYIVKPFSPSELVARVAASLRKQDAAHAPRPLQSYRLGDLTIDYADRRVTLSGRPVPLSSTESKLLLELSSSAGRVLTQEQILSRVWGPGYSGGSELLRAMVKNLRRKLGDDANDPTYIFTEPRVGYRMAKP